MFAVDDTKLKQKSSKKSSQSLNGEVISVKISVDLVFPFGKLGKPPDSQNGCFFFRAAFDGSSHAVLVSTFHIEKRDCWHIGDFRPER